MEATMIDKRFADKPISFEISMGNSGNTLDGQLAHQVIEPDDSHDHEDEGWYISTCCRAVLLTSWLVD